MLFPAGRGTQRRFRHGLAERTRHGNGLSVNGRKVIWVMRLPQIDPPFRENQRWRDGCMMPPITWRQRLLRQIFPRRSVLDCCLYHGQDLHAIAAAVITVYRQIRRRSLESEEADELMLRLLQDARLTKDEQATAMLFLTEGCGIQIWRPPGERRWTYYDGRHRARALMDAGVRRILVTFDDERRLRG